jgi:hypothetical protein
MTFSCKSYAAEIRILNYYLKKQKAEFRMQISDIYQCLLLYVSRNINILCILQFDVRKEISCEFV